MRKILALLFLVSLVLAGCNQKPTASPTFGGFIGGKDGLVGTLEIASSVPNQVLDAGQEDFQINLKLDNKGQYRVKENELLATVTNIRASDFAIKNPSVKNDGPFDEVRVESGKTIAGTQSVIGFPANYQVDSPVDIPVDVGIDYCYKYETLAVSSLCIRKDATKPSAPTDKCKISEQKVVGNQGGPVSVVSPLSERASAKNEITITFSVQNTGKGTVFAPSFLDTAKACVVNNDLKNKVNVKVSFPGNNPPVSCGIFKGKNEGTLQLVNNMATVSCKINTIGEADQTATILPTIELDYVYMDSVASKITVKNAV